MSRSTRVRMAIGGGVFILAFLGTLLALREPTERLTMEALRAARQRWDESGIRDYRLRYRMHGAEYEVTVEGGIVTGLTTDGRPAQSATPRAYGIDGLFDTLRQELDNLNDPAGPFAGQAGQMVVRVRFHASLGYLERYLRSGAGSGRGASIELIEFTPGPASRGPEPLR